MFPRQRITIYSNLFSHGRCIEPPMPARSRGSPSFLSSWRPSEDFIQLQRNTFRGLLLLYSLSRHRKACGGLQLKKF